MEKLNRFIAVLNEKPFIKSLINDLNAEVLAVGGVVRDLILNKPNKDIDLIIRNIPIDLLISHLQKFGKVDVVGKSFGVIKFIDSDDIDYDLALPRKEKPSGEGGYHGFDIQSDENLPIEDDLIRRDAKMNAMAINLNTSKFVDPLGGLNDIENKQISAANPEAFSDDPLRMLRAINFASRFGFTIEPETMQMIKANASRIKEIPPERILTEFDKIVTKGNIFLGAKLLGATGIYESMFGTPPYGDFYNSKNQFNKVKTMGEFIYLLTKNNFDNPEEFYKSNLKGDIDTYKEIKGLNAAFEMDSTNPIAARSVAHNMYLYSPLSLQSQIIPDTVQRAAQELLQGKYPKSSIELAVNGNDLMNAGLKGKEIGDMQKSLLVKIYADKVKNIKEDLLALISGNEINEHINNIDETKNKWYDYKYDGEPFYFDPETLTDSKWQVLTNLLTKMGWQARPYTEWKEFFIKKGAGTIPNDTLRNTDSSDSTKIAAIKKVITPNNKPSESQNIITKAKRYFGITNDFKFAGYILLDGTMLDFSGRKFGNSYATDRSMDHREVNDIGTDMIEFMALGNIRMQTYGFELTQEPTKEQINTLRRFIGGRNGEVKVDFSKKGEYRVEHSVEYNSGANVSRILNDILNYYRTGIKPISKPNLTEEISSILYSAVVLDEQSRAKLLKVFRLMIPEGWEVLAHHMTINMGAIKPEFQDDLGDETDLSVLDYAIDDKVMAVGVEGYPTTNAKAHITLAVNRNAGGKPMMSNNLTDWKEINFKIELKGIVTEIKK